MRFEISLENYKIKDIPVYIQEITIENVLFIELKNEIDEFNKEIKWDKMWNFEDAKNRLLNNWKLFIFINDNKIKGWYWLDNLYEPRNIYVNKEFRNNGIAKKLQFILLNFCKNLGMKKLECDIDDWNLISMKSFKSIGWYEKNTPNFLE